MRTYRMTPTIRALCLGSAILGLLVLPTTATAVTITYQSQTGTLHALGVTLALGLTSQTVPIAGLADLDALALAEQGNPLGPDYYEGRAELQTTLGSDLIGIDGRTSGQVIGCDPTAESPCSATADAQVTITFDLDQDALVKLVLDPIVGNNGPEASLTNLDSGFEVGVAYQGYFYWQCPGLTFLECEALQLPLIFGPGITVPAGSYELSYDLYALVPGGSCAVGCNSAGGGVTFEVVPEPAPAALVGIGLAVLASRRRGLSPSGRSLRRRAAAASS